MLLFQSKNYKEMDMPNTKSAIKRMNVSEAKRMQNKMIKSKIATFVKKFKTAVEEKNVELSNDLFKQTISLIDKAAKENTIHKNAASRKQAQLASLLNTITE